LSIRKDLFLPFETSVTYGYPPCILYCTLSSLITAQFKEFPLRRRAKIQPKARKFPDSLLRALAIQSDLGYPHISSSV
jgi:hypothetical protein